MGQTGLSVRPSEHQCCRRGKSEGLIGDVQGTVPASTVRPVLGGQNRQPRPSGRKSGVVTALEVKGQGHFSGFLLEPQKPDPSGKNFGSPALPTTGSESRMAFPQVQAIGI